ncbi:MAG: hypothetical protein ABIJ56_04850 [Pseudomonadota bacterium]
MKSYYSLWTVAALALSFGCGGGGSSEPEPARVPAPAAAPTNAPTSGLPGMAVDEEEGIELIVHTLSEESFIESPSRRDPFRSFLVPLTTKQSFSNSPQILSILDEYQLDELTLIAIISGSGARAGSPIAMVEDPAGVGHVIRRGSYVGRGETVRRVSSGEEIQIFWKVARIREDAVVFEREDPFSATDATVTKILTLESK